jgi:hypothetical protein
MQGLGATTLPEFTQRARFPSEVRAFKTESTLIAPVKYQTLCLVTLTADHLAHPRICFFLILGSKIAKEALDTLPLETRTVIIAAIANSDLSVALLDKDHVYNADEEILWADDCFHRLVCLVFRICILRTGSYIYSIVFILVYYYLIDSINY